MKRSNALIVLTLSAVASLFFSVFSGKVQADHTKVLNASNLNRGTVPNERIDKASATLESNKLRMEVDALHLSTGNIITSTQTLQASINALNASTASINTSTGNLEVRVNNLNTATGTINTSTGNLEVRVNNLNTATGTINTSTGNLEIRVNNLNLTTAAIQGSTAALLNSISALNISTNAIRISTGEIVASINEINTATSAINTSTGNLEIRVNNLNTSTGNLTAIVNLLHLDTATIFIDLTNIHNATGNIRDRLNTVDNTTANAITRLDSLAITTPSVITRLDGLAITTPSLTNRLNTVDNTTSSHNTRLNQVAIDTSAIKAVLENISQPYNIVIGTGIVGNKRPDIITTDHTGFWAALGSVAATVKNGNATIFVKRGTYTFSGLVESSKNIHWEFEHGAIITNASNEGRLSVSGTVTGATLRPISWTGNWMFMLNGQTTGQALADRIITDMGNYTQTVGTYGLWILSGVNAKLTNYKAYGFNSGGAGMSDKSFIHVQNCVNCEVSDGFSSDEVNGGNRTALVKVTFSTNTTIARSYFIGAPLNYGIHIRGTAIKTNIVNNIIINLIGTGDGGGTITIQASSQTLISGNYAIGNNAGANERLIRANPNESVSIIGNFFDNWTTTIMTDGAGNSNNTFIHGNIITRSQTAISDTSTNLKRRDNWIGQALGTDD